MELSLIGDRLILRGMAKEAIEASHILSIVAQSSPRQAYDQFGREVQAVQQVAGFQEDRSSSAGRRVGHAAERG